ncbi:MAG: hypothetical protein KVP17_002350 [Porospora cf. gigantea B]|uniref:uncharacterized protein n=1 Tax=Porospora cf. gigantea B TaxID=2853592 RepID=UPI003571EE99|nr:MAG: hypothetical protein KVP17_002350 [Porospora cf. gigantea B]
MSHPLVPMRKLRQLDVTVKSLSKIDFDFHGTMHIATEIGEVKFDFNGEGETKPGDFYQKIELTPADTYREITFRAVNEAGLAVGESTFDLSLLHQNNDLSYKGKLKLVPEGMLKIAILGHDTVGDGAKESTVIQSDIHRLFCERFQKQSYSA